MVRPLSDLSRIAADLPKQLQQAQIRGVQKAALHVTNAIRREIRTASGGDMRLSGVGRRGAKVGARYDVKGTVDPTAIIRATGPLHFVESDMPPHLITPRRRVSKRWKNAAARGKADPSKPVYLAGARALKFADGRFAASAMHPGSRGKHPWAKGIAGTDAVSRGVFTAEIHNAMVRAIR